MLDQINAAICALRDAIPNPENSGSAAEWWSAAAAVIAAVGGIVAVLFTGVQLRQSRQAMEQASAEALVSRDLAERARKSSIRPLLTVPKAAVLPGAGGEAFLELTLRNDGTGPAVNVRVRASVFSIPLGIWNDRLNQWEPWRTALEKTGTIQSFPQFVNLQSIAAGQVATTYLMRATEPQALHAVHGPAVAFITLAFDDVDGTEYHFPQESSPGKVAFIWKFAPEEQRLPEPP